MSKWIVDVKCTSKEERIKDIKIQGEDPKDYDFEDFSDVEISVIREDNKHGLRSYGWSDVSAKIIIFGNASGDSCTTEELESYKLMAEILRDGLNKLKNTGGKNAAKSNRADV